MLECCRNPEKHHAAVFEKYSDRRYKRASQFVKSTIEDKFKLPPSSPNFYLPSRAITDGSDGFMPYDSCDSLELYNNMVAVKG